MQITATDLPRAARFYSETLGLPVQLAPDRATVSIGDSTLTMVPGPAYHGAHHIAFTIPAGSLASAKQWLSRRVTLQADGEWHDEFDCPPHWRARSIYFAGPDDAVLELIERNVLDNRIERAFGVRDIRHISEVGFGVPDVLQTQLQLRDTLGLLPSANQIPGSARWATTTACSSWCRPTPPGAPRIGLHRLPLILSSPPTYPLRWKSASTISCSRGR